MVTEREGICRPGRGWGFLGIGIYNDSAPTVLGWAGGPIFDFRKSSYSPAKPRIWPTASFLAHRLSLIFTGRLWFLGDFFGRTPCPLGKNENKWHKSASYTYHTNSSFRQV